MAYRCVATSVAGFVQQLAVGYVAHGYYFYVTGRIPDHKDPAQHRPEDHRAIRHRRFQMDPRRRKREGLANVHYLRYGGFFVLMANHGKHPFFEAEARQLKDIRVYPIYFMGYSIGCRRALVVHHASVRIYRQHYLGLRAEFVRIALDRSVEGRRRRHRA